MDSKLLINKDNINKLAELERDMLDELFQGIHDVMQEFHNNTEENTIYATKNTIDSKAKEEKREVKQEDVENSEIIASEI